MLSYAMQQTFNKVNDWVLNKNKFGTEMSRVPSIAKGNWKFSRDGGAVATYNLKDMDGVSNIVIPSGAIIRNVYVHVVAAVTSGGSLTLDVNGNAANDLLAAAAVATLTLNAKLAGIPDFATVADHVILTADRTLTIDLNVEAATAGEINVYVDYVF